MVNGLDSSTAKVSDLYGEGFQIVFSGGSLGEGRIDKEVVDSLPGSYATGRLVSADLSGNPVSVLSLWDPWNLAGGLAFLNSTDIFIGERLRALNASTLSTAPNRTVSINMSEAKTYSSQIFPNGWIVAPEQTVLILEPDLTDAYSFVVLPENNTAAMSILMDIEGIHALPSVGVVQFFERGLDQVEDDLWGIVVSGSVIIVLLVYSLMSIETRVRAPDVRIMRHLGSTAWEIGAIFIVQALFIAGAGVVIGIPLGITSAHALTSLLTFMGHGSVVVPQITAWGVVLPAAAAVASALVGGSVPVFQAARRRVRAADEAL